MPQERSPPSDGTAFGRSQVATARDTPEQIDREDQPPPTVSLPSRVVTPAWPLPLCRRARGRPDVHTLRAPAYPSPTSAIAQPPSGTGVSPLLGALPRRTGQRKLALRKDCRD